MVTATPTDLQMHLFHEGTLFDAQDLFGSHVVTNNGAVTTQFCVYAPHARRVRLVGSFNQWTGTDFELAKLSEQGIWGIEVTGDLTGELYKYELLSAANQTFLKSDPYALYSETRPNTASIVYSVNQEYLWNDQKWYKKKLKKPIDRQPVFIYEVHAGTWKSGNDGELLTYRQLAELLVPYVIEMGFTHIELMPITEHPYDGSWGYQSTGYFSPTSRYGSPEDLKFFIDVCHQNNIGVILDWVPVHFCKDAHGLFMFDGEPLYEYDDQRNRENQVWGTANFDLSKGEVRSFLISNAKYWMTQFHFDGIRVDAVANLIFWPNTHDKNTNPFGLEFIKLLNEILLAEDPHFLLLAEDSTDWPHVTGQVEDGGLGFTHKWNMGWMNDILSYMRAEPQERASLHHKITFSLMYAFSEKFVLPLSHDEVVHGKRSLLDKMPGSYEEKFAQLRLLYGFMIAHPGKKLLFMGGEIGQFSEWKDAEEIDWHLLKYDMHMKMQAYVRELLIIYKRSKPLYELDHEPEGFDWIDVNNQHQSVFSFIRKDEEGNHVVVICNFRNSAYEDYKVGVPEKREFKEILNSDHQKFGGSHFINTKIIHAQDGAYHGKDYYISLRLPPFGITILRPIKRRKETETNGEKGMHSNAISRRPRNKA